jgi:hypothetical protein
VNGGLRYANPSYMFCAAKVEAAKPRIEAAE